MIVYASTESSKTMRSLQYLLLTLHLMTVIMPIGVAFAISEEQREEVCMLDHFTPQCPESSVIRLETALYGRMGPGKCVKSSQSVGCYVNVMDYVDRKCSGRQSCDVQVGTPKKDWPLACDTDRFAYLEVSYRCLEVIDRGDNQDECRAIEPLKISALNGYLASVITDQTGKGSSMCPWEITTQSGMTIVLTLIDFGQENKSTSLARATGTVCDVYAKVLEVSVLSSAIMICGDAFKENVVYASTSNTVQVTIVHSPSMHYLIKFQVVGCPDFVDRHNGKVERSGGRMIVNCLDNGESWHASCVQGRWVPERTCLVSAAASVQQTSPVTSARSQGALILLVIGLAVVISVVIIILGILFLRCKSRRMYAVDGACPEPDDRLQYSTAMYYDGLRGPYPLLSGRQRTPSDWERFYATTLQMRQNIPQSNYYPSDGSEVWICPRHGQVITPIGTCDRRVNSTRPRLDDIHEISRQDDEAVVVLENGNRSPFYHQLDPNSLSLHTGPMNVTRKTTAVSMDTAADASIGSSTDELPDLGNNNNRKMSLDSSYQP